MTLLLSLALFGCAKPAQQTCPMPQEWGHSLDDCRARRPMQASILCECQPGKYPNNYTCEPRGWCIVERD